MARAFFVFRQKLLNELSSDLACYGDLVIEVALEELNDRNDVQYEHYERQNSTEDRDNVQYNNESPADENGEREQLLFLIQLIPPQNVDDEQNKGENCRQTPETILGYAKLFHHFLH